METFFVWGLLAALPALLGALVNRTRSVPTYIVVGLISFVVGGAIGWSFNPTLHPAFNYIWYSTIFSFAAGLGMSNFAPERSYEDGAIRFLWQGASVFGALAVFWIIGFVMTDSFFRARDYHNLFGQPETVQSFSSDVAPVDTTRLRVVNAAYATQLADKMLGEQLGLGSQVRLDTMHIAQLNGCANVRQVGAEESESICFEHELVWVAPVVHTGFFRWLSNRSTHHYALVSASDPSRRFIIDRVNGEEIDLRYHYRGAHFGDYLERHLRDNGYRSHGLTDFNFELDDNGRPWWVVVTYVRRIGFSGEDPTGVLVIDPSTGTIQEYGLDSIPEWVDRVQPEDMVLRQFDNWGTYGDGWLNSWTARRGIVQTSTYDLHLVEGTDGRTYWYTGVTSFGREESTSGFVLIDTKTRETRMYRAPGATEVAAQNSAQSAPGVRERQYAAGEPILYNMSGHPTYFMTLSGADNIPRMYAFVSVANFELVGVGETIQAALHQYEAALRNAGRTAIGQTVLPVESVEGTVLRIVPSGDSWALLLAGEVGTEYFAPDNLSPEVKYTQPGDLVRMRFQRSPDRIDRIVVSFDNDGLQVDVTE